MSTLSANTQTLGWMECALGLCGLRWVGCVVLTARCWLRGVGCAVLAKSRTVFVLFCVLRLL